MGRKGGRERRRGVVAREGECFREGGKGRCEFGIEYGLEKHWERSS